MDKNKNWYCDLFKEIEKADIKKMHCEFILIQHFGKKKIQIRSLSSIDGCDLITNSKGTRTKLEKKNENAQKMDDKEKGIQVLESTFKYFDTLSLNLNQSLENAKDKVINFNDIYEKFSSKTFIRRFDDFDRNIFLDTFPKKDLFQEKSNSHNSTLKHINYLDQMGNQLKSRKKKVKIPIHVLFHTCKKNCCIVFSSVYCVSWFHTDIAILSK